MAGPKISVSFLCHLAFSAYASDSILAAESCAVIGARYRTELRADYGPESLRFEPEAGEFRPSER
jgi:hypothetical protein